MTFSALWLGEEGGDDILQNDQAKVATVPAFVRCRLHTFTKAVTSCECFCVLTRAKSVLDWRRDRLMVPSRSLRSQVAGNSRGA